MSREQVQAEAFATAVDQLLERRTPTTTATTEQPLLDLAYRLWQTAPHAMIAPELRATLRQRLLRRKIAAGSTDERYAVLDTPIGRLHAAYRGRAICGVGLETDDTAFEQLSFRRRGVRPIRDIEPPAWLVARLRNHLAGKGSFKGAVDLSRLTSFQRRVLEKVREIPRGEVRPYAWVARAIGFPRAVRAVGTALGKNPVPLLIPCHRVIRSVGGLGGYSAGGPTMKARILAFEGVDLGELGELARQGIQFRGSRNTHIFCLPTCHSRKWARERNTVYFASAEEARRAGYRPCKLCRPA